VSGVAQLGVLSFVVANEGVQILLVLLNGNVILFIHSVEVANEGHNNLTLSRVITSNRRLVFECNPVILLVNDDIDVIIEDVRLLRRRDIVMGESPSVASKLIISLGLGSYLKTIISSLLFVVGENEAEFEVLLVGHLFRVEDEATVELPDTLIDLTVLLEKLQLHSIALSIIEIACCYQIVNLHISGLIKVR